ncbi:gp16 family protein [Vogesella sp. AC12]|uniref:gp16 family protein n=1 Tax=Vogesella sp. AC12 TaxID=2950550 RepID=UPI002109FBB0|nr:regulatory protein GemA [Vogesella sp. AC12]MCQ4142817.1 regulatory protein GemA [Vogesella sp. AC12]
MKNTLAKIHIAKKELGLDDGTYRAMLQNVAGVRSAKDLNVAGANKVIAHLTRIGWKPKTAKKVGRKPVPAKDKVRLMSKVEALLAEAGRPWDYAHTMAAHMFKVEKVDWLEYEQLASLMKALIIDAKRQGRDLG